MTELQKKLEEIKGKDNPQTLQQLLIQLFNSFTLENPSDCYSSFESYLQKLKQSGYDPELNSAINRMKEPFADLENDCNQNISLYNKINAGTEEDPAEAGPVGYVPNFVAESKWFEWAGVYFGEEEAYRIQRSLLVKTKDYLTISQKLSFIKQAKQVRFWGKILGSERDYYVAEGIMDNEDAGELPPEVEPKGQPGVNKLNYWVTNNLVDEWVELPIVTPDQINLARKIKHIFTGNLNAKVITNPFFFDSEQYLVLFFFIFMGKCMDVYQLKAQIVRISHSTTIVPKNFYHLTEDDPKEIELITEEFKAPQFSELTSLKSWQHLTSNILNEGRLVHLRPEFGADDDEDKIMKEIETKDPFEQKLKPLDLDQGIITKQAWILKTFGDITTYSLQGSKVPMQNNYGFIMLKSLVWDGAYIMYHRDNWQQIYVGYGFKATEQVFYPKYTQEIETEMEEYEDEPEPHLPDKQEQQDEEAEEGDNEND